MALKKGIWVLLVLVSLAGAQDVLQKEVTCRLEGKILESAPALQLADVILGLVGQMNEISFSCFCSVRWMKFEWTSRRKTQLSQDFDATLRKWQGRRMDGWMITFPSL